MRKPPITCQHEAARQADKPPTRTAQALLMVQSGATIAEAAKAHGIRRQSIYRLMRYRSEREGRSVCGACGQPMPAKK